MSGKLRGSGIAVSVIGGAVLALGAVLLPLDIAGVDPFDERLAWRGIVAIAVGSVVLPVGVGLVARGERPQDDVARQAGGEAAALFGPRLSLMCDSRGRPGGVGVSFEF
jgi:hypothetical protein